MEKELNKYMIDDLSNIIISFIGKCEICHLNIAVSEWEHPSRGFLAYLCEQCTDEP